MINYRIKERYIGDGVYAFFDGYHIILELSAQTPKNRIALEPDVFNKLVQYQKDLQEFYKVNQGA